MQLYLLVEQLEVLRFLGRLSERDQFYQKHYSQSQLYHQKEHHDCQEATPRTWPVCVDFPHKLQQDVDQIEDDTQQKSSHKKGHKVLVIVSQEEPVNHQTVQDNNKQTGLYSQGDELYQNSRYSDLEDGEQVGIGPSFKRHASLKVGACRFFGGSLHIELCALDCSDFDRCIYAALDFCELLFKIFLTDPQFLDFILQNRFIFSLDIDFLVVFEETTLVLVLQLRQLRVFGVELSLVERDTFFAAVYFHQPAFEDVDGLVEYLREGSHGGLPPAVGFSLTPDLVNDPEAEIFVQLPPSLLFKNNRKFLLGEQCFLIKVI